MQSVALRAHFDGQQILLDEPYPLEPNTRLIVTVLSDQISHDERQGWYQLSQQGLENAYAEEEVEYSLDMIKEQNPDYGRG